MWLKWVRRCPPDFPFYLLGELRQRNGSNGNGHHGPMKAETIRRRLEEIDGRSKEAREPRKLLEAKK